jgi:hypothetical protein
LKEVKKTMERGTVEQEVSDPLCLKEVKKTLERGTVEQEVSDPSVKHIEKKVGKCKKCKRTPPLASLSLAGHL